MELESVRAFLLVLDHGSAQAASNASGIPRSTLRRRMKVLERSVGTALLVRSPLGVEATEAGELVSLHGRALVAQADALERALEVDSDHAPGAITLVVPSGSPYEVVALAMAMTRAQAPELCLREIETNTPFDDPTLKADLVVHFGDPPPFGSWFTRTFLRGCTQLLASPSYLDQHGTPDTPQALADHELLCWWGPGHEDDVVPLWNGDAVPVRPRLRSDDTLKLRHLAGAGLGIAFCPEMGIPTPDMPTLVPVLPDVVGRELVLRVSTPKRASDKVRIAVDGMVEALTHMGVMTS